MSSRAHSGLRAWPTRESWAKQCNTGSRAAVLRTSEQTRSSVCEQGRSRRMPRAIRARDVRAADLQEEPTKRRRNRADSTTIVSSDPPKTAASRRTSQRAKRAIRQASAASKAINACPRWDSNPCWSGFKPPASAIWATGASHDGRCDPNAAVPPQVTCRLTSSMTTSQGRRSARRLHGRHC